MVFHRRQRNSTSTFIKLGSIRVSRRQICCLSLVLLKIFGAAIFLRYVRKPSFNDTNALQSPCNGEPMQPLYDETTRSAALKHLSELIAEFGKHNVTYFAYGATHFAAVIYGTLATWDASIDLGVSLNDQEAIRRAVHAAFPKFEEKHAVLGNIWHIEVSTRVTAVPHPSTGTGTGTTTMLPAYLDDEIKPFLKSGIMRDVQQMHIVLYLFEENASKMWITDTPHSFSKSDLLPLRGIPYEGMTLSVPSEELLHSLYGSDYIKRCKLN